MPINLPGLLVPFQLLFCPRIVLPSIIVKGAYRFLLSESSLWSISSQQDIRHLDFAALKAAGYRGAVFDKDNCITIPHKDTLVPEIQDAWNECRETFGEGNVLIVSNSAGTWLDPGGIQCESVTYHTGAPVLRHRTFKPAYSCITAVRGYFSSLRFPIRDEELIVVGDRIFTDVVMANRMGRWRNTPGMLRTVIACGYETEGAIEKEKDASPNRPQGPLSVWTTGVWQKESMAMRWCERKLVDVVRHWVQQGDCVVDTSSFIKKVPEPQPTQGTFSFKALLAKFRTA